MGSSVPVISLSLGESRGIFLTDKTPSPPVTPERKIAEMKMQLIARTVFNVRPLLESNARPSLQSEEDYIKRYFVSKRAISKNRLGFANFVKEINQRVYSEFVQTDERKMAKKISNLGYCCILKTDLDRMQDLFKEIEAGNKLKGHSDSSGSSDLEEQETDSDFSDVIRKYNSSPKDEEEKEKVFSRLREVVFQSWEHYHTHNNESYKTIPKESLYASSRDNLFQFCRIEDYDIKVMALKSLIELMKNDPLSVSTAHNLVKFLEEAGQELQKNAAQNQSIEIQELFTELVGILACNVLSHYSKGNINAVEERLKDLIWDIGRDIEGKNAQNNVKISYWAAYTIQAAQHLKTDLNIFVEWFTRFVLIAQPLLLAAGQINSPEQAGPLIVMAYENLTKAIYHIRWRKEWFHEVVSLERMSRYCVHNIGAFRGFLEVLQIKKRALSGRKLFWGMIQNLEYVITNTVHPQIQEEGLKMLLQFLDSEEPTVRQRTIHALGNILKLEQNHKILKNTVFIILKLIEGIDEKLADHVSGLLSGLRLNIKSGINFSFSEFEERKTPLHDFMNVSVVMFMIRNLAEIKRVDALEGSSFVTMLCSSREAIATKLLSILKKLSLRFLESDIYGNTPYHIAVLKGHLSILSIIENEATISIDAQEYRCGNTALHLAIERENWDAVRRLVALGANLNLRNKKGDTPLHIAVRNKSMKFILFLLQQDLNKNIANDEGMTPLSLAIREDQAPIAKVLIEHEAKVMEGERMISPICFAVHYSAEKILMELIQMQGENLSKIEAWKILRYISNRKRILCSIDFARFHLNKIETDPAYKQIFEPFCWSILSESEDEELRLIERSPMHHCPRYGNPPLILKIMKGEEVDFDEAEINVCNYLGLSPLHAAIVSRRSDLVSRLIAEGAHIDAQDERGFTPLHFAVYMGCIDAAEVLLKAGANPNCKNCYGHTPLIVWAGISSKHHPDTIESISSKMVRNLDDFCIGQWLFSSLAESPCCDFEGNNLLHHAFLFGNTQKIAYLVRRCESQLWERNNLGHLPLESAVKFKKVSAIQYMLRSISNEELFEYYQTFVKREEQKDLVGNSLAEMGESEILKRLIQLDPLVACHQSNSYGMEIPLHIAAREGNLNILNVYLESNCDIDVADDKGNTPAHLAAAYGHKRFFRALINSGKVDLRKKNKAFKTPLHLAVMKNHISIGRMMVENSPELAFERDSDGNTALHLAARFGHSILARYLLLNNPKIINAKNDHGNTPLHLASVHGKYRVALRLIKNGADIEAENRLGETPLLLAAQEGRLKILKLLLRKNAHARIQDKIGESAIHRASHNGHYPIVRELLNYDLHSGVPAELKFVNLEDNKGERPLHELPKGRPNAELLRDLLENGAEVNHQSQTGEALIHLICSYGTFDLLATLEQWSNLKTTKIKVNFPICDQHGNTGLHKAAEENHIDLIDILLRNHVKATSQNNEGRTPLHVAVMNGHYIFAQNLIERGAPVSRRDREGKTILHHLFENSVLSSEMGSFLERILEKEPRAIFKVDNSEESVLHVLARGNHCDAMLRVLATIPAKLKEKGQEFVWKKNIHGKSPYDIAKEKGHSRMRHILETFNLLNVTNS